MITIKSILTIIVALGLSLGAALGMGKPAPQAAIHQALNEIKQGVKAVAGVGAEIFLSAEATAGRETATAEAGVQADADVGFSAGVEAFLHQTLSTIGSLSTQAQGQAGSEAGVSATTDLPEASADVDLGMELSFGANSNMGK
jgi:hypothetical protein